MSLTIIAEIGASHGKDLERTKRLCTDAIRAGADMVKLQTYTPDSISHRNAGICPSGPWAGRSLYDLYQEAHMPLEMQDELIQWLKDSHIRWLSTPFSVEDFNWLEERGCPTYKISSFDRENQPLWHAISQTKKPVIASDGMGDVQADVVLRCVSAYPADPHAYALGSFAPMGAWGISDHTLDAMLGVVAVAQGATVIEKHIKCEGDTATPDSSFALTPAQFCEQITAWRTAYSIATSAMRSIPSLADIMPRPVMIDGKELWRRG